MQMPLPTVTLGNGFRLPSKAAHTLGPSTGLTVGGV
jgi:hypothetical protein